MKKESKKYPQGHWMNIGLVIGIALGFPIGLAMGNIAVGFAIGVAIGVAMGSSLEQKHKPEVRPLTGKEKKTRILLITIAFLAVLVLFVIGFLIYFIGIV